MSLESDDMVSHRARREGTNDKPFQAARQTNVGVGVDENLHVEHFQHLRAVEGQDALEDDHVGTVHRLRGGLASVRHEVVNGNFHLPSFLQLLQCLQHQFKVERIRMVKVVFIQLGLLVLLFVEDLVKAIHRQQRDPRHIEEFDDFLCDGRLARCAPAANSNHEGIGVRHTRYVVPRWSPWMEIQESMKSFKQISLSLYLPAV